MGYYTLPPEAVAAADAYWAAVDPYYYNYYRENGYPPVPPYYGYDYAYPYSYDPYYDYTYDQYATDMEYETTSLSSTPVPEFKTEEEQNKNTSKSNNIKEKSKSGSLQAIRSVTDIHCVYSNQDQTETEESCDETNLDEQEGFVTPTNQSPTHSFHTQESQSSDEEADSDTDEEDDDDEENDSEDEGMVTADEHIPHQLSVIFEEGDADPPPGRPREASVVSEDDSSTTIAVESDGDVDENEEETVTVRLPLRFKFTKTDEDEEVTTVIVGDSQVVDSCNNISVTVNIPSPPSRQSTTNSITEFSNELTGNDSECESDSSTHDSCSDSDEIVSVELLSPKSPVNFNEVHISVKDRIKAIENGVDYSKTLPSDTEERYIYDEDEVDSGVTSQTDTESDCFNEMRKCGSYKRAATHSRLYRLLHGESDDEDEEEDKQNEIGMNERRPNSLPLSNCSRSSVPDSFPSSGIASPASTPPRRPQSTLPLGEPYSGASTPGDSISCAETWSDYASYYSSWDDRARAYMSPTVFMTPQRTSPFPITIPRCPMTPCPGGDGS